METVESVMEVVLWECIKIDALIVMGLVTIQLYNQRKQKTGIGERIINSKSV